MKIDLHHVGSNSYSFAYKDWRQGEVTRVKVKGSPKNKCSLMFVEVAASGSGQTTGIRVLCRWLTTFKTFTSWHWSVYQVQLGGHVLYRSDHHEEIKDKDHYWSHMQHITRWKQVSFRTFPALGNLREASRHRNMNHNAEIHLQHCAASRIDLKNKKNEEWLLIFTPSEGP